MRISIRCLICLMTVVELSSRAIMCEGKRAAKDWGKMNLDDLEKQWEDGDEEEELKSEKQAEFERLERRRKAEEESATPLNPRMFNDMNADQIGAMAAGQKDAAGPTMMFAQVSSSSSEASRGARTGDGGALSKEETDKLGGRLAQMALLGGLEVSVYAIDAGSVLVSSQRGWEGKQILDFLLSRPEVSKVTWNSKEFLPPTDAQEL